MLLPVAYGFDMLDHESQDVTEFRSCMHQWRGMERNVQKVEKVGMWYRNEDMVGRGCAFQFG